MPTRCPIHTTDLEYLNCVFSSFSPASPAAAPVSSSPVAVSGFCDGCCCAEAACFWLAEEEEGAEDPAGCCAARTLNAKTTNRKLRAAGRITCFITVDRLRREPGLQAAESYV